jgi:two-component system nitrogen regulation sensor histidine kinase GlnL
MSVSDTAMPNGGAMFHEALLSSLPHPIVCIGSDSRVAFANPAAEQFFDTSAAMLKRQPLGRFLVPDSPLLQLVEQAQTRGMPSSVYGISIILPRLGERMVDATVTPVTDVPDAVLVVLQERSIAMKIDRHMTQKSLGNSVASDTRARNQEPAGRHQGRGTADRAECLGSRPVADTADL